MKKNILNNKNKSSKTVNNYDKRSYKHMKDMRRVKNTYLVG